MKIPDSIRIGGVEYEIKDTESLNDGIKILLGQISYDDTEIRLNRKAQSYEMACITLWHEILHGISNRAGLDLGEKEEEIIDTFAFGIYQILQDNGRRLFDLKE